MDKRFIWFDVSAEDTTSVAEFYGRLLGWSIAPEASDERYAGWIMGGEQPWAGVTRGDKARAGRWIPYVPVEDLDAARDKALALGGSLIEDKRVGPGGTGVTISDPAGAVFVLFAPRPD